MGILFDPNNVVIGQAAGYFGLPNTEPPPDAVALFGDWGTDWAAAGATEEGWTLNGDQSTTSHNIEEQAVAVRTTLDTRTFGISAQLAEDTLENIKYAFGGGTITTTQGSGGETIKEFRLSSEVEEFAVGLDMATIGGKVRRIYIPRAVSAANVEASFRRSASKRLWPVQFVSTCKESELLIKEIAPPAEAPAG